VSGVDISDDTGTSDSDFLTKTAAQTISGTLSATLAASDILNGSVNNGSDWTDITSKVSGTGITWNGATLSGSSNILFKITDAAGNDSNTTGSQAYVLDTTAPTALLISCSISSCLKVPLDGYATVQSTETGTAYLVKTGGAGADITVNNLASITGAEDYMWNSVPISSASTNTNLETSGLRLGTYKVYAVDAAGNLSGPSTGTGGKSGALGSMNVEPD
jgi:hypothetical protein